MSPNVIPHSSWTPSLMALLQRQLSMMNELVSLAESQAALISGGHTERLLNLLTQRQHIIDAFAASQSELGRLTVGIETRLAAIDVADRVEIKTLMTKIGEKLEWIMKRDELDQAQLRSERNAVKSELSMIGTAQQARGAYQPLVRPAARFADQHG